jgi:hypothetical protein
LERILLPMVKYSVEIERQKPRRSERPRMSDNALSSVQTQRFRNNQS